MSPRENKDPNYVQRVATRHKIRAGILTSVGLPSAFIAENYSHIIPEHLHNIAFYGGYSTFALGALSMYMGMKRQIEANALRVEVPVIEKTDIEKIWWETPPSIPPNSF